MGSILFCLGGQIFIAREGQTHAPFPIMRNFATYIVAKPGVAPGTMLKPGCCRASFIIGVALAYGHKKSPKNGAFVYKFVYKFCKSLNFKVYCGERGF